MSVVYSTYLGGSLGDAGYAIAVDAAGQAYVAGITVSRDFPATTGAFRRTLAGGIDVFVAKINPAGTGLVFATLLGGEQQDYAAGIAVDAAGNAHVAGQTCSTRFPTTPSAVQPDHGGGYDAFLAKLDPGGARLLYSTYLGAYNSDMASGVALDSASNAYVVGITASENFPATAGALQPYSAGPAKPPPRGCGAPVAADAFVAKVNPTGSALVYSTLLGGGEEESALAVAVDAGGAAYVTGVTSSLNFPTTPGAFSRTLGGRDDVFVAKLNPDGTALIYSTYLGGGSADSGHAIAVGSGGSAFVAGFTASGNFPTSPWAVHTSSAASSADAFVAKLDPDGTGLSYSARLGGAREDRAWGLAVDGFGNAYLTGTTISCDFPSVRDAVGGACPNTGDGFLAKLVSSGGAPTVCKVFFRGGNPDL